jgi:purine-nucleoside phosphorylase
LLKEANDQCDESLKGHLFTYSRTVEEMLMMEATAVSPVDPENTGIYILALNFKRIAVSIKLLTLLIILLIFKNLWWLIWPIFL